MTGDRASEEPSQRGDPADFFNAVEREEFGEEWNAEQKPLLEDLRAVGICLDSVYDFVNGGQTGTDAIPILIDHLRRPYSSNITEGIARALATPAAAEHWRLILREFEITDLRERYGAKQGLGAALSVTAGVHAEEALSDLSRLMRDRRHGETGGFVVEAIAESRTDEATRLLEEAVSNPLLRPSAEKALRRRKSAESRRRPKG